MEETNGPVVGPTIISLTSDAFGGDPSSGSNQVEVAEMASNLSKGILEENSHQEVIRKLETETNLASRSAELIRSETIDTYFDTGMSWMAFPR